jgi:methionyl aminopeptidase
MKIGIKTPADIEGLRASAQVAARVRDAVAGSIRPGVRTAELADYAHELMRGFGAESAFLGYRGFPGVICVSVNEVVVHGVPGDRVVQLGDIVSIDIGVRYGAFVGDTATTVMVGVRDREVMRLVATTERALEAGIAAARDGSRLGDVSHAIGEVAVAGGFSVVRDYVGHGIGREMHEEPQIPNMGKPGTGPRLRTGMALCLEPMINMGGADVELAADGWTVLTKDRRPSAHFEHTVIVRERGGEVLSG